MDVFRGVAILAVVLFHYGYLPYGYLGVDLFFVVSGFLVSQILVRQYKDGARIDVVRFIVSRGFKIWPSYYFFLFAGSAFAALAYVGQPQYVIKASRWPWYLLFYQNYRGTYCPTFDHVWSLCVEEHFYLLLPVGVIVVQRLWRQSRLGLFVLTASMIAFGIIVKFVGYYVVHFETFSATHNRIDALAWGVLLCLLWTHERERVLRVHRRPWIGLCGVALLAGSIYLRSRQIDWFRHTVFNSVVPFAFFLMLLNALPGAFRRAGALRVIACYSYNWYLWHALLLVAIRAALGDGLVGLIVYLVTTFAVAVCTTAFVEEPVLARRRAWLVRIMGSQSNVESASSNQL